jgi:uncharacterized membrane-anchored protein YhcB (DUF1043 family)
MEIISLSGLIVIISVSIIAFLIGYFVNTGSDDNNRLEKELEESRKELKNYRTEVSGHFQATANKVNALTENYRDVYEHLARGAQSLCDKGSAPVLMNELNRNPMLGSETVESTEVDHETASAEMSTETDSSSDSEPEKTDETPEETAEPAASEDQAKLENDEADQSTGTTESSEVDKAIDESADSDKSASPADEQTEPDQQSDKHTPGSTHP